MDISGKRGIKHWPAADRPREKLWREGEHRLSNSELLAILLGSGSRQESALDLSRRVMGKFRTFRALSHTDPAEWREFKGLGRVKLAQIKAAIEIGRRFREDEIREVRPAVRSAADVAEMLSPRLRDLKIEVFKVVLLNTQNRVIDIIEQGQGTVTHATPIIREILQAALQRFAAGMICVHNHPSGETRPSGPDERFTRRLARAADLLGLRLVDHVIIADEGFYSFAEEGRLPPSGEA